MRAGTGPRGRAGRATWVAVAAIGKAGMCSSRGQGVTIRSQAPPVLWSAMRFLCFLAMGELLALGEQVGQPLQLGGAYLQVRGAHTAPRMAMSSVILYAVGKSGAG